MKTKYTPGPYTIHGPSKPCVHPISRDPGGDYAIRSSSGQIIAEVFNQTSEVNFESASCNANLMAAAPELLEAVKHLSACDYPDEVDFRCEGCNNARKAISKAEGRL